MAKVLAKKIDGIFKEFGRLLQVYRNDRANHNHIVFAAVAAII